MTKISTVIFDKFTDIDLFLMWNLLNRVRIADWSVKILGEKDAHVSATGISIATHGRIKEANDAEMQFCSSADKAHASELQTIIG